MTDFPKALAAVAADIDSTLNRLVAPTPEAEARVVDAMRYVLLGGGKRLRGFLVLAGADLFGVAAPAKLRTAAAVEMVHAYSLVHDDLPAMDDDDLRRGQPSTHKAFDEATAILAGDALQAQAFEVLADPDTHPDPAVRSDLVRRLAHAIGPHGMVGGQTIDLLAAKGAFDPIEAGLVTRLQQLKTGALIRFACEAGAILGRANQTARQALAGYAHDLGLAYQITDDLLDATGDSVTLGKTAGKDAASDKATLVALMGVDEARAHAHFMSEQAVKHLDVFDDRADPLRALARFAVERTH